MNFTLKIITFCMFLLCFVSLISCNSNNRDELDVYAAASLYGPLNDLKTNYNKSLNIDYGGSIEMINKVNLGANPDILIIADLDNVKNINENLNKIALSKKLLTNEIVLIYKKKLGDSLNLNEICDQSNIKLGIADPLQAPLGKYSIEILDRFPDCKKDASKKKLRIFNNAMVLINTLKLEYLDAALIYRSDLVSNIKLEETFMPSDEVFNTKVYYPIVIMKNDENARKKSLENFINFIFSEESRELFSKYGFELVSNDFR